MENISDTKMETGRILFPVSCVLLYLFILTVTVISFITYSPFSAVYLRNTPVRKALWMILIPSAFFLPFAVMFANMLSRKFTVKSVISVFVFSLPVVFSLLILKLPNQGYILPGVIFVLAPFALYFTLNDLAKRLGESTKDFLNVLFGILYLLITALLIYAMTKLIVGGSFLQIKFLFVLPFAVIGTPFYSMCTYGRFGAYVMLARCCFFGIYCIFCGIAVWMPYVIFGIAVLAFIYDIVEFIIYIKNRKVKSNEGVYS